MALGLVLSACSAGPASPTTKPPASSTPAPSTPTASSPAASTASELKAGMVTTVGGLGDQGFNDSAWAGLEKARTELGATTKVLEPTSPSQFVDNLNQLASGGYLAFGVGFLFTDAVTESAGLNPDAHFAIVDSVVDAPNVMSLTFREEQGSYLAGVLAAKMTTVDTDYTDSATKTVGFLGAMEIPIIKKFEAGFVAGVKSVDPDIEILIRYVGTTVDAFVDPQGGYENSLTMIDAGADVIYHAAGGTGAGLFQAAQERDIFAIGVDLDQGPIYPESPILTSMIKRVDVATFETTKAEGDGTFAGGTQRVFGLEDGGIDLAPFYRFDSVVPQDVKDALAAARAGMIDGSIEVPSEVLP
jgi:basic membrane protein A and related proteins